MNINVITGDCRELLAAMPDQSVHCCVTSPPYFGLRDYGVDGQMGLEATPDEVVLAMVAVFREVRRVLVSKYEIRNEVDGTNIHVLRVFHTREAR